jgi:hypothetical protein
MIAKTGMDATTYKAVGALAQAARGGICGPVQFTVCPIEILKDCKGKIYGPQLECENAARRATVSRRFHKKLQQANSLKFCTRSERGRDLRQDDAAPGATVPRFPVGTYGKTNYITRSLILRIRRKPEWIGFQRSLSSSKASIGISCKYCSDHTSCNETRPGN